MEREHVILHVERKQKVILHGDKGLAALPFPVTLLMLWLISLGG